MQQSVTFQATSSACSCLYSFPPNKRKSEQLDERSSITSTHKGVEARGRGGRDRPQNGGRLRLESRQEITGGWRGGQEIDLKMEADYDWSPDRRLQGGGGEGKR